MFGRSGGGVGVGVGWGVVGIDAIGMGIKGLYEVSVLFIFIHASRTLETRDLA